MDAVVKNSYFKLPTNNITFFTLGRFFLKKIKSNSKPDTHFFYSLIRKASDVKKINVADGDKNMSATTLLVTKSREDCQFQHSPKESKGGKNDTTDKFSSDKNSNEGCDSSNFDSDLDVIEIGYYNCF